MCEKSKKQKAIVCYFHVRNQRGGEYSVFASIFQKEAIEGDMLKTMKIGYLEKERK